MSRPFKQRSGIWADTTRVVKVDEQHSITLRKPLFGDQQEAISAAAKVDPVAQTAQVDFARLRMEQVARCVIAWSGPDLDDVPLTRENILQLPVWIGNMLVTEISNMLNEGEDNDTLEKK